MVAYLEKSTGSAGFHQIIDFINRSHIHYALTKKPEVCVSFIKQFWRTAEIVTNEDGNVTIHAKVDGHSLSITEGSIRRHLKLDDIDGLISLPSSEIFAQLARMGYATDSDKLTFQKGAFSPQWRFLIHLILHCLSPKKTAWEQFSSNIAVAIICLATNRRIGDSRGYLSMTKKTFTVPAVYKAYSQGQIACISDKGEEFSNEVLRMIEGVHEKQATETELLIQKKKGTASEEVPPVSVLAVVQVSMLEEMPTYSRRSAGRKEKIRLTDGKTIVLTEITCNYQVFRGDGSSRSIDLVKCLSRISTMDVEQMFRVLLFCSKTDNFYSSDVTRATNSKSVVLCCRRGGGSGRVVVVVAVVAVKIGG
ncbi:hypothetical protein Tco_0546374 [Tanacetum coccineum]